MKRRTVGDPNEVEFDPKSKTLGLEDHKIRETVDSREVHQQGEKCLHWRRLPDGSIGYMDVVTAVRAPCRFCMGGGVLLGKITLEKKSKTGVWVAPTDFKAMEDARRSYVPRKVS